MNWETYFINISLCVGFFITLLGTMIIYKHGNHNQALPKNKFVAKMGPWFLFIGYAINVVAIMLLT
jgi:hypothetical protein